MGSFFSSQSSSPPPPSGVGSSALYSRSSNCGLMVGVDLFVHACDWYREGSETSTIKKKKNSVRRVAVQFSVVTNTGHEAIEATQDSN